MSLSFGQVIPVTGPNVGFPGTISRLGTPKVAARPVLSTATHNLNFGDPALLIPATSGTEDAYDSVLDFVSASASNAGLVASYFAGVAVREVKTELTYPSGQTPGFQTVGYYQPGSLAEVLELDSATVNLAVGTPKSQAQLYTRVVANAAVPAGSVGDWETNPAASDLFSFVVGSGGAAAGQAVIPVASTANIQVGQVVYGQPGIPATAVVLSIAANTSITLSANLTQAIAAAAPITVSNLVALPNTVARTGFVDANNSLEITIKVRNAA